MNLTRSKTFTRTACLFSLLITSCVFISYNRSTTGWLSLPDVPVFALVVLAGLVIAAAVVVAAVKTTIVTWITVLVLLAFAGKRRRVLVVEGKKITVDVAMYVVRVVIKEKSLVAAVACATTIVSSMAAMALLRKVD